jgi:macrolide transport system ATP-binding/permease protein
MLSSLGTGRFFYIIEKQGIIMKNCLSEVIGRLTMPSKRDDVAALDKEYHQILDGCKRLKG